MSNNPWVNDASGFWHKKQQLQHYLKDLEHDAAILKDSVDSYRRSVKHAERNSRRLRKFYITSLASATESYGQIKQASSMVKQQIRRLGGVMT